jgi:hypothetical protein
MQKKTIKEVKYQGNGKPSKKEGKKSGEKRETIIYKEKPVFQEKKSSENKSVKPQQVLRTQTKQGSPAVKPNLEADILNKNKETKRQNPTIKKNLDNKSVQIQKNNKNKK